MTHFSMSIMRKLGIFLLLVSCLVMSLSFLAPKAQASLTTWLIETVDASLDVGCDSSIAMDSDDHPHIAYYDRHWENLKYAQWTGTSWSIETVHASAYVDDYSSLALDSLDNAHI